MNIIDLQAPFCPDALPSAPPMKSNARPRPTCGSAEQDAWPQHRAVAFLDEADTLIMSPSLFERRPVRRLDDIASHVLLSTETRPGDWTDWLNRAGLLPAAEQRRRVFDHFFVTR